MATSKRRQTKPAKPSKSFPLTAHNNGQWCKKIRGKIHFFGVWGDPQAALDNYLRIAADLHSGRQPRTPSIATNEFTVKDVCNHYLTFQLQKFETGQISPTTFEDCRRITHSFAKFVSLDRIISDLTPKDFEQFRLKLSQKGTTGNGKGLGVHALGRAISIIKSMFKYAYGMDLIDKPLKYGPAFEKPSAIQKRKSRQATEIKNGKRLFEAKDILLLLKEASVPLKAMILLGINGGLGNTDCAKLPIAAANLDQGIIEFDRPKTGLERTVPLWPETVKALQVAIKKRPKPLVMHAENLIFLTTFGQPWVRKNIYRSDDGEIKNVTSVDSIILEFNKLLKMIGIKRKGISFYTLRHTFRTWADEVNDQHAIHRIMGHAIPGMSGIYVERIGLDRLRAVVDHVHKKLFSSESQEKPGAS